MGALEDFQASRSRLFALAYRMLGSVSDAEDVLQDAFVRYQGVASEEVRSAQALLTTMVTRLCLSHLDSGRRQREAYAVRPRPAGSSVAAPRSTWQHSARVSPRRRRSTGASSRVSWARCVPVRTTPWWQCLRLT